MNYRHSFHAGNFADCLKHLVLVQILKLMKAKEKGFMVLDAFSGIGIYDLHAEASAKSPEYIDGIVKVWDYVEKSPPTRALAEYLEILAQVAASQRFYPGSPFIIAKMLRPQDRAFFTELHKEDIKILNENIAEFRRECECKALHSEFGDGYNAVKAKLPPSERRGLIFIDPPFEKPDEFRKMIESLKEGLKRFETGVFCLWYADKNTDETRDFIKKAKNLGQKYLNVRIQTQNKNEVKGLVSAGLLIINPPFGLYNSLKETMPELTKIIAKNQNAKFVLESSENT